MEATLQLACREGRLNDVKRILRTNPNVNVNALGADDNNRSAFHTACAHGHEAIVALLLAHPSVLVNQPDRDGRTPFFSARTNQLVVRLLLQDARVDVNLARTDGQIPLSRLTTENGIDSIRLMIASGRGLDFGRPKTISDVMAAATPATPATHADVRALLQRFRDYPFDTVQEIRQELGINEFRVRTPETLLWPRYRREYLGPLDAAVAYGTANHPHVPIDISSMDALRQSLRRHFEITSPIRIDFYGADFNPPSYILNDVTHFLETERPFLRVTPQTDNWWDWDHAPEWIAEPGHPDIFQPLLVKRGANVRDPTAFAKFKTAAFHLGFDHFLTDEVYAINNPTLAQNFAGYRTTLHRNQRDHPQIFLRDDWRQKADHERRGRLLNHFDDFALRFTWNNAAQLQVIPMLHATSAGNAATICRNGFAPVGLRDPGFYGRGVYFTPKLHYAAKYNVAGNDGRKVFVLSMVIPGNPFPVTEHPHQPGHLRGSACANGYQSHFTMVDGRNINRAFPLQDIRLPHAADELVVFESAQALPMFIFYVPGNLL